VTSYRSVGYSVTAVPDIERFVERLQHGLQHDGHAGARLQEDQLLPDDPLCGDTTAGLREGIRGPESHLVSVHTHALRVWGLRALHVVGGKGPPGGAALPRACTARGSASVRWMLDGSRSPEVPGVPGRSAR